MTGEAANDACEARDDALNARCATWLAAIADDDEQALTALYDATLNRTYAIAIQILRDPMLAEDVVAEVYHDVWQHAARFDATRGQPIPWLLTICRNRALDAYRREASASRKVEAAGDEPNDNMVAAPEDLLSVVESGRAVHEALTLIGRSATHRAGVFSRHEPR